MKLDEDQAPVICNWFWAKHEKTGEDTLKVTLLLREHATPESIEVLVAELYRQLRTGPPHGWSGVKR